MKKRLVLCAILLIASLMNFTPVDLQAAGETQPEKKNLDVGKEPIRIDADRLDAYNDKRLVVFAGNAVAVQGDKVIKSDKILLYYKKKEGEAKKGAVKDIGRAGDLERIEAKGHVIVTQGERVVTGEEAVYFQDAQKIVVTGNPVMREKKNVIRGDRIVVFVKENRGMVESSQHKRVTATVYPTEKDEGNKQRP
ncbi:lipopolysaccharide export system protein LptA [Syntrophus gentianae]|uniref:Lipopolysaccharide export system protein LptA n=2 Tax=Syntrophus gentianae TaxID=43775 RepID=A0A1H7WZR0_9BACT|nr:lipopolysaccharide export system protein LptA [Syntrophus gentianae]